MKSTTERPNILLIVADDMGFSDIGCFGSEIATPNLDELGYGGMRLTQMYTAARCCPSRASLLTGLYPHQAGLGHMVNDAHVGPAYQGYLRNDCVTVAEVLKTAGYTTLLSGKWHVGGNYIPNRPDTWSPGDATHPLPVQRGFDRHYGMLGGAGSYFDPPYMIRDEALIAEGGSDFYLTDQISDEAVAMLRASDAAQPFFLYVAYTAPHWPLQALPEDIAKYVGRYRDGGWDALRQRRFQRLKDLGLIAEHWELSGRDEAAPPWAEVEHKDWEDLRMAVYAAQIDRMDQGIGRMVQELKDSGRFDNTLILFISDNGGCAEFLAEDSQSPEPFRYDIPTADGRPLRIGNSPSIDPGPADTFMSYDLPWANASNTPFRLFKHWVHEGGIATPCIVHWPAVIQKGAIRHEPLHVMDLMATFAELGDAQYPAVFRGNAITPLAGESFATLLDDHTGESWQRQAPIFWEHEGNKAVRDGRWKLVRRYPGDWELYDMDADRTEVHDLAAAYPQVVQSLAQQYDAWARRCGVRQWPL